MTARGLLLAMMEPPPAMEEEFQDWYDTEHFPERATCEGFLTALRFICIDGWPRYLALYDLADTNVLRIGSYRVSGGNIARMRCRSYQAPHFWATTAPHRGVAVSLGAAVGRGAHLARAARIACRAVGSRAGAAAAFGEVARHLDLVNTYVPHVRRLAGALPKGA
jgi:hypothetical protein